MKMKFFTHNKTFISGLQDKNAFAFWVDGKFCVSANGFFAIYRNKEHFIKYMDNAIDSPMYEKKGTFDFSSSYNMAMGYAIKN